MKTTRQEFIEDNDIDSNPAKKLAKSVFGKIPLIYSGPTITDVIGVRWKGQVYENAKNMAFANQYAEFNHNELVGWADQMKKLKKNFIVIQLHDSDDHNQIVQRMDIVHKLIAELGIDVLEVNAIGATSL